MVQYQQYGRSKARAVGGGYQSTLQCPVWLSSNLENGYECG
jgi:hypothetical protein